MQKNLVALLILSVALCSVAQDEAEIDRFLTQVDLAAKEDVEASSGFHGGSLSGYVNDWDKEFTKSCGSNQAVTGLYSEHDNRKEDRKWKVKCSTFTSTSTYRTSQVNGANDWKSPNSWDGTQSNECSGGFMTSLHGVHDNRKEDRQYKIKCTKMSGGGVVHGQGWGSYANSWDKPVDFNCPSGQAIVGMYSVHDNGKEDRRFKFQCGDYTEPTASPSRAPTSHPTHRPTQTPTEHPTTLPPTTNEPSPSPTFDPTEIPTPAPSFSPTEHPTDEPTHTPTHEPTHTPTEEPTAYPTRIPTEHPTTHAPSPSPSHTPTEVPTPSPSHTPSEHPTLAPTVAMCECVSPNVGTVGLNNFTCNHGYQGACSSVQVCFATEPWRRISSGCKRADPSQFTGGSFSGYLNHFNDAFTEKCDDNQAVTGLKSVHDNWKEDRRWKMKCSKLTGMMQSKVTGNSWWTSANDWDEKQDQECTDSFMTGLHKKHSNWHEDNRFKIHCTKTTGGGDARFRDVVKKNSWSDWVNAWDKEVDFSCPAGEAIVGMKSVHDNGKEDRRFKFRCGEMGPRS